MAAKLKMLLLTCGLGQHFQDLDHSLNNRNLPAVKQHKYSIHKVKLYTVPFCQDTFVYSGPRDVKQFHFLSLRLSSPKQRVRKINKTCSHKKKTVASCYLIFDKTFVLSSLHLQHVTKATDMT